MGIPSIAISEEVVGWRGTTVGCREGEGCRPLLSAVEHEISMVSGATGFCFRKPQILSRSFFFILSAKCEPHAAATGYLTVCMDTSSILLPGVF